MTPEVRQQPQPAVHVARTVDPLRERTMRSLIIGVVAALVLTVVGALGTDQAPIGLRLGYWLAVVLPGSLLGLLMAYAVQSWGRLEGRPLLETLLVSVMVAVPHTFIVVVASTLMFGFNAITPSLIGWFGVVVLFVSLVLTAINFATSPKLVIVAAPVSAPVAPAPQPQFETPPIPVGPPTMPVSLAERLPVRLQSGRLLALEAEDHYLRVHTDLGSDLVLMRMVDAIAMLIDVPGARVHRSWWVARGAVDGASSDAGRTVLHLTGVLEVPVSRAAKLELVAAGWL